MEFDYSKLRGKIREVFSTQEQYANSMDLSETSITNKLNNNSYFTQAEIIKSIDLLKIDVNEIGAYFFTLKVEK